MKKLTIFLSIVLTLSLFSCQFSQKSDIKEISSTMTYFRDTTTNLCFAVVNSASYAGYSITTITCVPCDSLKNVLLTPQPILIP